MEPMKYLEELVERYPVLDAVKDDVQKAYELLEACYEQGGKLLIAGNGGSCADAEHIVGELMKGFVKRREVSDSFAECLRNADEVRGTGEEAAGRPSGHCLNRPRRTFHRLFE